MCAGEYMKQVLVDVQGLSKSYIVKKNLFSAKHIVRAVDDVSFQIHQGEILGLIGESGCGKTTVGSLLLRLLNGDKGRIIFDGIDISELDINALRGLRKDIQVVFQLAQEVLDPKMTIEEILAEPLALHHIVPKEDIEHELNRLLGLVGLGIEEKLKFPYQLSGGQKQRVGIARAIASRPRFVVCDEPVSALDVSVQGQILNLLLELKHEMKLTYLFISHDLKVVKHICDRIAVMYQGKIVEIGPTAEIINNPQVAYTRELFNSML
jgi:ABC-type oligopeptide transport system ATPase subunit